MKIYKFTTKDVQSNSIQTLYARANDENEAAAALSIIYNKPVSEFRYNPNLPYSVRTKIFNKEEGYNLVVDFTDSKQSDLRNKVKKLDKQVEEVQVYTKTKEESNPLDQFIKDIKALYAHKLDELKQYWGVYSENDTRLVNAIFENMILAAKESKFDDAFVDEQKDITVLDALYAYEANSVRSK